MNLIENVENEKYKDILKNYNFTQKDALLLVQVKHTILTYEDELLKEFYKFIFNFNHAKSFLHNEEILQRHERGIKEWFRNLFCGNYNSNYFYKLNLISEIHVRIGLPAHYVNAAFSFIRRFIKDRLSKNSLCKTISSIDKIIDINLDILTISYRAEEQTKLIDDVVFLKTAVENSWIEPYAQAIFNSKTKEIERQELLMRVINLQTNEIKSVFTYLEISKKIHLYNKMMTIMIDKSFEYFSKNDGSFSINLSYEDIANKQFRNYLYKKLESFPSSQNICFEILETDIIEDFSIVEKYIKRIKTFGCKIAIDDFGSGFSSMENILKLNPETIKIDGSLIKDIHISEKSKTIVKNIINMAKELNAKTVAEYVHCKEVYDIVIELGVDYLQGFYLQKPQKLS